MLASQAQLSGTSGAAWSSAGLRKRSRSVTVTSHIHMNDLTLYNCWANGSQGGNHMNDLTLYNCWANGSQGGNPTGTIIVNARALLGGRKPGRQPG